MADFRKRLISLAGAVAVFSGLAFGQLNCSTGTTNTSISINPNVVRAEGNNEQLGDVTFSCVVPTTNSAVNSGLMSQLSVTLSPTVTITSVNVGSSASPKLEILAGNSTGAGGNFTGTPVNGTVSGSTITFANIPTPATTNNGSTTAIFTITNIKVAVANAGLAPGSSITAAIQTLNGTGNGTVSNGIIATNAVVGFVQNGLASVKTTGGAGSGSPTSNQICTTISAGSANYAISLTEGFVGAFRVQGTLSGNAAVINNWQTLKTETGYFSPNPAAATTGTAGNNIATSGTRIKVIFGNVPTGASIYIPVTVSGSNSVILSLATTETGSYAQAAIATPPSNSGLPSGSMSQVSISNGTGTAIYEVTQVDGGSVSVVSIPVTVYTTAAIAAPSTAITNTVSFAPQAATSNVPSFSSTTNVTTVNGSTFSACASTLLFPYVTNTLGFDTGLAIANTSSDLLTTKNNAPSSIATAQSGTCALSFFGTGVPSTNPITTAVVASGQSYISTASAIAPGFQGYMIANCNFLYAHGFAFVAYGLATPNGAAMGYLADVILGNRQSTVPSLTATFGTTPAAGTANGSLVGLSFNSTNTVGSNTPEQGAH